MAQNKCEFRLGGSISGPCGSPQISARQRRNTQTKVDENRVVIPGIGICVTESLKNKEFWREVFAEYLGALLLLLMGLGGFVLNFTHKAPHEVFPDSLTIIRIGLCFGVTIGGIVFTLGHVSAHINPAMTLACVVLGKVSLLKALFFVIAQLAGAISGCLILYAGVPRTREEYFMCTRLEPPLDAMEGYIVEVAATSVLILLALSIVTKFEQSNSSPGAAAVGLVILITILVCFAVSSSFYLFSATLKLLNNFRLLLPVLV